MSCVGISACTFVIKPLGLCIAHLLALKEKKDKMKRGERKMRKQKKKKQNNRKLNIKKEKKYPCYRILNQQLIKHPHVGIHFFFFFLSFNPFSLYSLALVADRYHQYVFKYRNMHMSFKKIQNDNRKRRKRNTSRIISACNAKLAWRRESVEWEEQEEAGGEQRSVGLIDGRPHD